MTPYTTHDVAAALRATEIEKEVELDLWAATRTLPYPDYAIVLLYAQGYSPHEAVKKLGLTVHPHRTFKRILRRIRDTLNGNAISVRRTGLGDVE